MNRTPKPGELVGLTHEDAKKLRKLRRKDWKR